MSLLMDALKRAETSKQEARRAAAGATGHEAIPASADNLSLEPLAGSPPDGKSLPDLAAHIDALDAELAITPPPAPAPRRSPPPPAQPVVSIELEPPLDSEEEKQAAARNAFAAKLAEKPSRRPMWLALGTLGLAAAGIGTYVFFQLQSMSSSTLAPATRNATPAAPRPAPPPTAISPPAVPLTPAAPKGFLPPNQASTATGQESASIFAPRSAGSAHEARPEPARRMAAADSPGAIPIRLTRTRPEPDTNAQAGYAKLQGNQLDAARHDYEQALKTDPNNVDTLLALAAIAQRQGRSADADRYQQRAIDADPRDPAAQAAVLGGASGGDQIANESRLKSALAAQPESGPLNFALGNLYARQGRWSEAQQVYFNAVAADADNPDYLFNLAISLDHLRQPKLAAQHYRLALDAAQRRPAAFDRERVRLRLAELGREN
jgi:tetratricopeptide (TPR) repeat protein